MTNNISMNMYGYICNIYNGITYIGNNSNKGYTEYQCMVMMIILIIIIMIIIIIITIILF